MDSQSVFTTIMMSLIAFNGFYYLYNPTSIWLGIAGFLTLLAVVLTTGLLMSIDVFGSGLGDLVIMKICAVAIIIGILFQYSFTIDLGVTGSFNWAIGLGMIQNLLTGLGTGEMWAIMFGVLITVASLGTGIITVMQYG